MIVDGARRLWTGPPGGIITYGLMGRWPFDEGSGNTTADTTANGNDGTLTPGNGEPGWVARNGGYALGFNYLSKPYVDLDGAASLVDITKGTLSIWAQLVGQSSYGIIAYEAYADSSNFISIRRKETGDWTCRYRAGGINIDADFSLSGLTHIWAHLAFVWDTDNSIQVYLDGVPGASNTRSSDLQSAPIYFRVGNMLAARSGFEGRLDEPRLYNRRLSDLEIAQIAQGTG